MPIHTEHPKITIILLNYKRPQNIPIILKAIRNQTVKSTVFLWNNGDMDVNSPLIDRYEKSDKNVGCMARWKLAKEATTPYVMSLDDDICFKRNDAIESIIQSLEEQDNPNRIVGFMGSCFSPILIYQMRKDFMCRYDDENHQPVCCKGLACSLITNDTAVDCVKGRSMAFRKELLDDLILPEEREDDICLSGLFAKGTRKFHRIPMLLHDAFFELPDLGMGNCLTEGHFSSRNRALQAYFSSNCILDNWLTRYVLLRICIVMKFVLRIAREWF